MVLPLDWDVPKKNNSILCKKFEHHVYSSHCLTLPYRAFFSKTKESVPLVVYLHGADAVGTDNELQLSLHDIGTMFARDAWQEEHPCHILAPQYFRGKHWSADGMGDAVHELIMQAIHGWNVDESRIYLYGYSAGAVGTLRYLKAYPDLFAGAIAICGATGESQLENLRGIPLWLVHAEDDRIVKVTYREDNGLKLHHYGSRDLYGALQNGNPTLKYTEYPAGYMKEHYGVNPHCSWVAVSDERNPQYVNWLFQCRKGHFD